MLQHAPLITTLVAGFVLAFVFGAIASRLRMPPLIGYLVAGVAVGPYTPGLIADAELAHELAEIGVILLMFGVGLNFSLKDLISVQAVAIPGALLRIVAGTLMGLGLGTLMGWPLGGGLIFGLALSIASTVVVLKALHDRHLIDSDRGRIAVGWVIVEDVVTVIALVLIPVLAGIWGTAVAPAQDPFVNMAQRLLSIDLGSGGVIAVTLLKLVAFVGFMLVLGRRLIPWILHFTAHTGSRELFRLAVLAIALGVAAGASYLFGVSLALGAFFAGMILSESELSLRAAEESLPFRDAFAVLFFVSVGMLFDPAILITDPLPVLATLFIIIVGKSAVGFVSVLALRRPVGTALTVSAGLAQVGEFSFILATFGLSLGLLPSEGRDLIIAGAIISIVLNPLLFWGAEHFGPALEARFGRAHAGGERLEPELGPSAAPAEPREDELVHPTALTAHTVLIGYGRVGSVIAEGLKAPAGPSSSSRMPKAGSRPRAPGIEVIEGNAATPRRLPAPMSRARRRW
jgi:monovalent cation:H+ antiporter-2, CPA2 family